MKKSLTIILIMILMLSSKSFSFPLVNIAEFIAPLVMAGAVGTCIERRFSRTQYFRSMQQRAVVCISRTGKLVFGIVASVPKAFFGYVTGEFTSYASKWTIKRYTQHRM